MALAVSRPTAGRRVVVTGLGAVSPNGGGREAFWAATRAGRSGVKPIRAFDVSHLPTRIAGVVDDFDPSAVMSANDLKHVPRVGPLALAAAQEAAADAGLNPLELPLPERRRFGVVIGSGGAGLEFIEKQFRQYYLDDPKGVSLYTIPSATPGSLSSEISMKLSLRGASHVISTGCTSSTDAIGHAMSLIRYGRADRVLVGGSDSPIGPGIVTGFCLMRIMSTAWNDEPERASRPFSKDRDGFVIAEGAWMLVLEERDLAMERGVPILGELIGYGATCEAFHRVRLDENGEEPARAMRLALEDAGVAPSEIDYLNAHGTATALNDVNETMAIKEVFGDAAKKLAISSTKSMHGHLLGASGGVEAVACIKAIEEGFVPPTTGLSEPDPRCDLDYVPNVGRNQPVTHAMSNSFAFGGLNAVLVFGPPPA
jgi:3-oxoacyl-[acyl-carrier-protein] synthase II